jgi:hypothetical protein
MSWDVYKIAKKAMWLGTVEAPVKAPLSRRSLRNSGVEAMTQAVDLDRGRNGWINQFNHKVALPTDNP